MKRTTLILPLLYYGAFAAILLFVTYGARPANAGDKEEPPPPVYNPYPPGILPNNLDTEIARVLREIDVIEGRAIERWQSLPPPTRLEMRPGPNPPVLKDTGTESIETLGELMLFDRNMSPGRNEACMSCHMPYAGWSGPIPSVNLTIIAYPGTAHYPGGQADAAATHILALFSCAAVQPNTRALLWRELLGFTRHRISVRNPDAEQAQGPPVDTQEMGFPDTACVAFRLTTAAYRPLFELVWGAGSLNIKFPKTTEAICDTPGGASRFHGSATPVPLTAEDRTKANEVYGHWGQSIDSYEQSAAGQRLLI